MTEQLDVVTDASFASQVGACAVPYLVVFSSPDCGPCRALHPVLLGLADELRDRMRVGQLNIIDQPLTTERFSVLSTPSMILFIDGAPVRRLVGAKNRRNLFEALSEYLPSA